MKTQLLKSLFTLFLILVTMSFLTACGVNHTSPTPTPTGSSSQQEPAVSAVSVTANCNRITSSFFEGVMSPHPQNSQYIYLRFSKLTADFAKNSKLKLQFNIWKDSGTTSPISEVLSESPQSFYFQFLDNFGQWVTVTSYYGALDQSVLDILKVKVNATDLTPYINRIRIMFSAISYDWKTLRVTLIDNETIKDKADSLLPPLEANYSLFKSNFSALLSSIHPLPGVASHQVQSRSDALCSGF